jgi:hypothetical protein
MDEMILARNLLPGQARGLAKGLAEYFEVSTETVNLGQGQMSFSLMAKGPVLPDVRERISGFVAGYRWCSWRGER